MRLSKEQPDGTTKTIVIPNKPELIQRLVDHEGWVEDADEAPEGDAEAVDPADEAT